MLGGQYLVMGFSFIGYATFVSHEFDLNNPVLEISLKRSFGLHKYYLAYRIYTGLAHRNQHGPVLILPDPTEQRPWKKEISRNIYEVCLRC